MQSVLRQDNTLAEPWMFVVFILVLISLAYIHNVYPSRYSKLFKATFNERLTRQVMREELVFTHRASLLLLIVSVIVISLLALLFIQSQGSLGFQGVSFFLITILALIILFLLRQGMRSFMGVLTGRSSGFREFNFVSALIAKVLGISLLPITVLGAYFEKGMADYLFPVAVIIFIMAFLYRIYRGWRIGRYYGGSIYQLIMYLCALELMPTLVFFKIIMLNVAI